MKKTPMYRLEGRKIFRGDEQIAKLGKKGGGNVKFLGLEFERFKLPINALLKREGVIEGKPCGKPPKAVEARDMDAFAAEHPYPPQLYSTEPPPAPIAGSMTVSDDQEEMITAPPTIPAAPSGALNPPIVETRGSHNYTLAELKRMTDEMEGEKVIDYKALMVQLGMAPVTGAYPPLPVITTHEGDKAPAVVEWYRDYQPEEFLRRYKVEGRGMVPQYNADGDRMEDKEMFLAHRQTHITAKIGEQR